MTACSEAIAERTRHVLIGAILDFLSGEDLLTRAEVRTALERELDAAGPGALLSLRASLLADTSWDYCPADDLARRIHHLLADRFLQIESAVHGLAHLGGLADRPVVICANHLSYADANVIDVLLERAGAAGLARRLTALAGPKVFTERQRRFSSLCFGTIKVPQSTEVSSEEAKLPTREVARAARQAIAVAGQRLAAGDALLLFAEGTRSRTGEMRLLLAGGARYLEGRGLWILPVGLTGPEELFPIGDSTIRPCRVVMNVGRPMPAEVLHAQAGGDRRVIMDAVGLAIAELVPSRYRGAYADPDRLASAREALTRARACAG